VARCGCAPSSAPPSSISFDIISRIAAVSLASKVRICALMSVLPPPLREA
jgi:hypothetical protein